MTILVSRMGYDLHITRKENWFDEDGPLITGAEWRALIERDPELTLDTSMRLKMKDGDYIFAAWNGEQGALGHYHGEITAKNPDKPLIIKMVNVAKALGAKVQGDDGETYKEDGSSFQPDVPATTPAPPRQGLIARIAQWFQRRRSKHELRAALPKFRVGQRVKNSWGQQGTVIQADPKAQGGLGILRVRMDDGKERNMAFIASGFEIVADQHTSKS
jgi:hypothetical protein